MPKSNPLNTFTDAQYAPVNSSHEAQLIGSAADDLSTTTTDNGALWAAVNAVLEVGYPQLIPTNYQENLDILRLASPHLSDCERVAALLRVKDAPSFRVFFEKAQTDAQTLYRLLGGLTVGFAAEFSAAPVSALRDPFGWLGLPTAPSVDGDQFRQMTLEVATILRTNIDHVAAVLSILSQLPDLKGALYRADNVDFTTLELRAAAGVVLALLLRLGGAE